MENEPLQSKVLRPSRYVVPYKLGDQLPLHILVHGVKPFQDFGVCQLPERFPLVAENVADVGQGIHVVAGAAQDDGRKVEAVDRQDVRSEGCQDWGVLPSQVDGGGAVDG